MRDCYVTQCIPGSSASASEMPAYNKENLQTLTVSFENTENSAALKPLEENSVGLGKRRRGKEVQLNDFTVMNLRKSKRVKEIGEESEKLQTPWPFRRVIDEIKKDIENTEARDNSNENIVEYVPGRRCRNCNVTRTSLWRKGPEGPKTLCNACGIIYNSTGKVPDRKSKLDAIKSSERLKSRTPNIIAKKFSNSLNTVVSRRRLISPTSENYLSVSPEPVCEITPEPSISSGVSTTTEIFQKPSWLRKTFLKAGLYSSLYKTTGSALRSLPSSKGLRAAVTRVIHNRVTRNATKVGRFEFPLPINFGEHIINTQQDFFLTYDILEEVERGGRRWQDGFVKIRSNIFVGRKPRKPEPGDIPVCSCKPPKDGGPGCLEDCYNRMMFYECSPKHCPCGEQCSNQRFQRREGVKDLEVFWTKDRGHGLRSRDPISRSVLVIEYRGEVISQQLCIERMQNEYRRHKNYYFLDYGNGEVVDACRKGTEARFVNHSCDPNCHIEKWSVNGELHVGIFASRDVPAGTELFYDYNFSSFAANKQECRCGAAQCRGVIGGKRDIVESPSIKRKSKSKNRRLGKKYKKNLSNGASQAARIARWKSFPTLGSIRRAGSALGLATPNKLWVRWRSLFLLRNLRVVEQEYASKPSKRQLRATTASRAAREENKGKISEKSSPVSTISSASTRKARSLNEVIEALWAKRATDAEI